MLYLIYLIPAILCLWGGCLVARLVANRLEHGLFRRKKNTQETPPQTASAAPATIRRSAWWSLVGFGSLALGGVAAFVGHAFLGEITSAANLYDDLTSANVFVAAMFMAVGLSAGLTIIGWQFDPSRGRRRCPKCWYDLSGAVAQGADGRRCPECGHEAASERALFRARRSRATIAIAVLPLVLAPIVFRAMEARRVGWRGWVPTTAMVLGWEYLSDDLRGDNFQAGSLVQRLDEGEVWRWQAYLLCVRCERAVRLADEAQRIAPAAGLFDEADSALHGDYSEDSMLIDRIIASRFRFLIERLTHPSQIERERAGELLLDLTALMDDGDDREFLTITGLTREELLALVLPLLDSAFVEAREYGLAELVFLQHVPDAALLNKLESLLMDPAVTWWQCHSILNLFYAAPDRERVREIYAKVLVTQTGKARANLLRSVGELRSDWVMYDILIDTLRHGEAAMAKAVTFPLSGFPGKEREVLTIVVERLERDPTEAADLLYVFVSHFEPKVPAASDLYVRALPHLLPLMETGKPRDALSVADLLTTLRSRGSGVNGTTPGVRAAMEACLRRQDMTNDNRQAVVAVWTNLFQGEEIPEPAGLAPATDQEND